MRKKILSVFFILILCVLSTSVIHAEDTVLKDEIPFETSVKETSPEEDNNMDNFKLIVKIPDNGEYIVPSTIRFNLFTEDDVWLGNRAVDINSPGRIEMNFPVEKFEIGTKFKIVATTGLISFDYYGTVFNLNDECIIETYAYRDENHELFTCTEGFVTATVETDASIPTCKAGKEAYVNSNNLQSETDYFIWVSKENFTVNVFLKNNNSWKLIQEFPCSIGAPDTPTVTGEFKYYQYQDKWQYNGYYVGPIMRFYNGYAIHSTLVNNDGTDRDGRVGKMISHGCVRVRPETINWLVSYVPIGTKIYVTEF